MGYHLARQLGNDYRALGSAFYAGKYLADAGDCPEQNEVASAHTPAIRGGAIARSFGLLRGLPDAEPWAPYTQADLDSWVAAMAGSGHPAG